MHINWDSVAETIYWILKSHGANVIMKDEDSEKTVETDNAIYFEATFASKDPELKSYTINIDIHKENNETHIDLMTPALKNQKDLNRIEKIKLSLERSVRDKEGPSIRWSKLDKTISPKPDTSSITESKDISRVYGTTKSSFQRVGECKLIIRHSDPVDESKQGSRWRKIRAVFVETRDGERFKCNPYVAEARALARHISNGGTLYDEIGESIKTMGSDYMNLKRSARLLRRAGDTANYETIREAIHRINKDVKRLSGPRGYATLSESLKNRIIKEDNDNIAMIHRELSEKCGCTDPDSDESKSLLVAARHLAEFNSAIDIQIKFIRKPDISSKAAGFTDQKQRLAWQVKELADCMEPCDIKNKLVAISTDIEDNRKIDSDDIELIRKAFMTSTGNMNVGSDNSELERIRTLSGI